MSDYIDNLVTTELDKIRKRNEEIAKQQKGALNVETIVEKPRTPLVNHPTALPNGETQQAVINPPVNQVPEQPSSVPSVQQPELPNYNNPWGYDKETMDYLSKNGFTKERLEGYHNFDPSKSVFEQLKAIEQNKPQLDEKILANRRTWGALGDSMKLLAQLGAASAGAYIQPNDGESLTDYFMGLEDKERNKYLEAMNRYNKLVNETKSQNIKNQIDEYNRDRKELGSVLERKQKNDQWFANQKRLSEVEGQRQTRNEKLDKLREKQVDSSIERNKQLTAQGWARYNEYKKKGEKEGKKDYMELARAGMNDKVFLDQLSPEFYTTRTDPNTLESIKTLTKNYNLLGREYEHYLIENARENGNRIDRENPVIPKITQEQSDEMERIANKYPNDDESAIRELSEYLKQNGFSEGNAKLIINNIIE